MKLSLHLTIASLVIAGVALGGCPSQTTSRGPYASATGPSPNLFIPSGYQTVTDPHGFTCGPDWHVCHYENRDRLARGQQ